MTAEEFLKPYKAYGVQYPGSTELVPYGIAIEALEIKEREFQDKLREIRRLQSILPEPLDKREFLEILDKYISEV